ncbi:MAG: hypothetical protein ACRC7O_11370, partial [Fimbriiglobus sp.]
MFAHLSVNPHPLNLVGRGLRKYYRLRARHRDRRIGDTPDTRFDLQNPAVVNSLLRAEGLPPLSADPAQADESVTGAAAYVAGLLCERRELHEHFAGGLAAGPDGPLCRWLTGHGRRALGLTPRAAEHIRTAFAESRMWKAALAYQARLDIRTAFPLGLTPRGHGSLLVWAIRHGTAELGFAAADALWAAFHRAENASAALADTFAVQPRWQEAVPHGLTRFGWDDLKRWVSQEYGLHGGWLAAAALPPRLDPWDELQLLLQAKPDLAATFPHAAVRTNPGEVLRWVRNLPGVPDPGFRWRWRLRRQLRAGLPDRPRVTLLGLFRYSSGLQQAAKGMSEALTRAGVTVDHRDVPGPAVRENPTRVPLDRFEIADISIIHTGLDTAIPEAYARAGLRPRPGVYRVATWWWELEQLPEEWLGRGADADEIWAPTRFIADALKVLGKPVFPMLPGIEFPAFAPAGKAAFDLAPDKFTFVVLFDANSRLGRKNPLGAVRAFRRAFPDGGSNCPAEMVVKMTPPSGPTAADVLELRRECAAAGVRLIEAVFSRE